MPELPQGTVTLLFTDVEGSTRLARLLGVRYDDSLAAHRRLLREAFAAHGGVEVDTQGDALFFSFARAHDAVEGAAAGQRSLATHDWPQDEPVRVRMGVHTGEPELSAGGYYVGVDLTRGARICAGAHGGQVVLSQATRDLVGDGFEVRDLDREPGLADPARPRQRQQRRPSERVEDLLCLAVTADERSARQREVPEPLRLQRREVEAEARRDELEQPLGPRDALEEVVAEIAHLEAVADEVTRRLREHDLSTVRGRADTCTAREVDADVVPAGRQLRLARVDTHPHPDRLPLGPVVRRERELPGRGARERVTRALEGEEERVALRVDLDAAVHGERRAQQLPTEEANATRARLFMAG